MSIFETEPQSLKHFKEILPIGQKMKLVAAYKKVGDVLEEDAAHKQLNILREVAMKRSEDIVFRILEGAAVGKLSHLQWPKATQLTFLNDERGFYGFRIDDSAFGVSLVYNFIKE